MHQASPRNTLSPATTPTRARFDPRRVYVALVALPCLLAVIVLVPPIGLFFVVLAASILAGHEFYRLHLGPRTVPPAMWGGFVGTGLLLASAQWPDLLPLHTAAFLILTGTLALLLLPASPAETRLTDAATAVLGALYLGLTLSFLLWTRALPGGIWLVCFLLFVTWAGDTGAYYAGSVFGRHALVPRISPKKTIEGLIGGWALAFAAALLARASFIPTLSFADCAWTSVLLTGAGLAGDLIESALKRSAGVKDSGRLLPGHGGMLDRIDSLLFTGPTFYYYVTLIKG